MNETSPATRFLEQVIAAAGKTAAPQALAAILDTIPNVDLAALAYDWENFWARPKQLPPLGEWRSWGFLAGRGFGKTSSIASHLTSEIEAGRITLLGMAAQNEAKTYAVQVEGLIEAAPPWFKPVWESSKSALIYPNGARARAFTPEAPDAIRSDNYEACWMSELQSWPMATREEAYSNFLFCTRVGYARRLWDATPKKRNPILKRLLALSKKDPLKHVIVRGSMYENTVNLNAGVIADLEEEFGGTQKGEEEIYGRDLPESEGALFNQEWIDKARRDAPSSLARRVISVDPAVTTRAGNDRTGIADAGLGYDGQVYVLGDYSDRHAVQAWPNLVIEKYIAGACDCVVVETNKGGDLVTQSLRGAADGARRMKVVVLRKDEPARRTPGVIYVREVHARGSKEDRAQPLATAYQKGKVSHTNGADLVALEELLTTWEPSPGVRSPDAMDALVHACVELLGLASNETDAHEGFEGILDVSAALTGKRSSALPVFDLASILGHGGGGISSGRI